MRAAAAGSPLSAARRRQVGACRISPLVGRRREAPAAKPRQTRRAPAVAASSSSPGGGVAERPTLLPGLSDRAARAPQRPRPYRVLLHNDDTNKREYVVQVLLKVIDGMTIDIAMQVMQEANDYGTAVVVAGVAQPEAERFCEGLRSCGLVSSIEPVGGKGEGGGGNGDAGGGGGGPD